VRVFCSVGSTRYTKEHEWVRLTSEKEATIGITDYAQSQLGDVVFVDLPEVSSMAAIEIAGRHAWPTNHLESDP